MMPTQEERDQALALGRAMHDAMLYVNLASEYEMAPEGVEGPREDQLLAHAHTIVSWGPEHAALVIHSLTQMLMAADAEEKVQSFCNFVAEQVQEVLGAR